MAKGKANQSATVGVNVGLLAAIASGSVTTISKEDAVPLLGHNPQLIEIHPDPAAEVDGKRPVKLTAAGQAMAGSTANGGSAVVNGLSHQYEIMTNVKLPAGKKRGKVGGAPTKYPWDQMEVGHTFFVPVSAEHPDPVKSLGSAVSSANMKYSEATGETKTVERTKRGEGNKAMLDAAGNKIKETVTRPVMKATRRFTLRAIEAGKDYDGWSSPVAGVLVGRVS